MLTRHPNQPPITDYPLPITSLPAYPPSPSIRIHPRSIPALRNLSLCAKKWAKISNRGGNELEDLREIRHFSRSNLKIFPYFLQKPRAEPEYLRLALSKTRFQILISDHWPPTTDYFFNVSRHCSPAYTLDPRLYTLLSPKPLTLPPKTVHYRVSRQGHRTRCSSIVPIRKRDLRSSERQHERTGSP